MKKILERLAALIDVKSIVTLCMTVSLIVLLFSKNDAPPDELSALYCTSYGAIITYFFTHKRGKNDENS